MPSRAAGSRRRKSRAGARASSSLEVRKDDSGKLWTLPEVESELVSVICQLDDNITPEAVTRSASFAKDFGWDDWFKMGLLKPVRKRLHESLSASVVMNRVKRVGDLMDYAWSSMEPA